MTASVGSRMGPVHSDRPQHASVNSSVPSGPARDLWIEILHKGRTHLPTQSGPARDLWIEISLALRIIQIRQSGPARDLWIEIELLRMNDEFT